MAIDVVMPRLSDTMEEGTIVKWLKQVGDPVAVGDVLAEVETDKATMELEAFDAGVLSEIRVKEGGAAPVGAVIAVLGDESGAGAEKPAPKPPVKEPPAEQPPVKEPPAKQPPAKEPPAKAAPIEKPAPPQPRAETRSAEPAPKEPPTETPAVRTVPGNAAATIAPGPRPAGGPMPTAPSGGAAGSVER
ncbi:MAG TPA: biotin/lipoyl-containing protein, partial [Candidatus Limnocylindria bacterium]|nr:biotin/lipoyl-containing protein [Candidatus Limnocylindria bacterium]